jgi:hypothetical protein
MKGIPQELRQTIGIDSNAILYHGTTASFTRFSDEYLQSLGFHFGCCEQAEYFAKRPPGGRIISARVTAQNLVDLRGSDCGWLRSKQTEICLMGAGTICIKEASELLDGGDLSAASYRDIESEEERRALNRKIMALLGAKGYDGVLYSNHWEPFDGKKRTAYIVFHADQIVPIKSVQITPFAAHLYQARLQFRHISERPSKGNKALECSILSMYQVAQSLGFKGDFRAWEHLLRIHE